MCVNKSRWHYPITRVCVCAYTLPCVLFVAYNRIGCHPTKKREKKMVLFVLTVFCWFAFPCACVFWVEFWWRKKKKPCFTIKHRNNNNLRHCHGPNRECVTASNQINLSHSLAHPFTHFGCWQLFIFLIHSTAPLLGVQQINWGNRSKSFEMYHHLFFYEHQQRVISS